MLSIRPPEVIAPKPEGQQIEFRFSEAEPAPNVHLEFLLLQAETEATRWRRRTMVLVSVFLHILFILLLVTAPDLFRAGERLMGIQEVQQPQPQTTMLFLPPDLAREFKKPPKTNILSDKNRIAQGKAPKINPNGIPMPYMRGNSKLPEVKGGGQTPEKQQAPPAAPPQPAQAPASQNGNSGDQNGHKLAETAPPKKEGPSLLDVPAADGNQISQLRMPALTPGEMIRQSASAAARDRASGIGTGPGDSMGQFQNLNPNFSTEGPVILSDTRGVDFGPYLARVVYTVRRNWYAVIPEAARLGEKGRVAVVFEILKDGSVPQIRLVSSSGADPLDRAALGGIRASVPFPPLPQAFSGNHLVLEFIFLYNIGYGQ